MGLYIEDTEEMTKVEWLERNKDLTKSILFNSTYDFIKQIYEELEPDGDQKSLVGSTDSGGFDFHYDRDYAIVCLVDCSTHKAAGVAFDQMELELFGKASDMRPKEWFVIKKSKVDNKTGGEFERYVDIGKRRLEGKS